MTGPRTRSKSLDGRIPKAFMFFIDGKKHWGGYELWTRAALTRFTLVSRRRNLRVTSTYFMRSYSYQRNALSDSLGE